jgi:hypothetical protein
LPPSAPAGVPRAGGVASGLRRAGPAERAGPAWPHASGLPALPTPAGCHVVVDHDLAGVVRRPGLAGLAAARGWPAVSGGRQPPPGDARPHASGRPEDAPQPAPPLRLRLSARASPGARGRRSHPGGLRAGPAQRRCRRPTRTGAVSPEAARVPAPGLGPRAGGHRRGGLGLPRPCGADPHAGLLGRDGAAPDPEVRPWQSAASPGHPAAARAVPPEPHADRQHPTPPALVGRCPTGAAAPSGRRHGGTPSRSASRGAAPAQEPGDPSARDGPRAGDGRRVPASGVERLAGERRDRGGGPGTPSSPHTGRPRRRLRRRGAQGLSAPAQAQGRGHPGGPSLQRVSPATGIGLGGRPGAVRAFGPPDGSEGASAGPSRVMPFRYLSPLSTKRFTQELPLRRERRNLIHARY